MNELLPSLDGLLEKLTAVGGSDLHVKVGSPPAFRINGVAGEYAELLVCSGVDTVKELKMRNAANLAEKLAEVNGEKKLTRKVPSETTLEGWIKQAAELPPKIEH